jgi:hypothetical protein
LRNLSNIIEKVKAAWSLRNRTYAIAAVRRAQWRYHHGKPMKRWTMLERIRRGAAMTAVLLTGCAGWGGFNAPSLSALEQVCGAPSDYGAETATVYPALLDAYVAYRHGRLSQSDYCGFQASIAREHAALAAGGSAKAGWADFINDARAKALSWRAAVDPTLRG